MTEVDGTLQSSYHQLCNVPSTSLVGQGAGPPFLLQNRDLREPYERICGKIFGEIAIFTLASP